MKPKFENTLHKALWYVLYLGSAAVAGLSIVFYQIERINLPTMISILAVTLAIYAALMRWAYTSSRKAAMEKALEGRGTSANGSNPDAAQRVNIYDIKMHNSPRKVIMEALTILLLIAAWGFLWVQHQLDWDHTLDAVLMTAASLGALVAARFPFMMRDAEEQENMSQINLSVKKYQLEALLFAVVLVVWTQFNFKMNLITLIGVFALVEIIFSRKNKSEQATAGQVQDRIIAGQDGQPTLKLSDIQVEHSTEALAFEVVTGFILLVTGCFLLLSLDVIKADFMEHATRLFLILTTAFLAINQIARAVKFAKMDEDVTNIKQFHLNVRESRAYGVEFAITSLLLAVGIKHQMADSATLLIEVLAMFAATYLIFNHFIKKAQ